MPAVTVAGAGVGCVVSSRFAGPGAHARALLFLRRLPLARPAVREDGQLVAPVAFLTLAREQAAASNAARRQRDAQLIIC